MAPEVIKGEGYGRRSDVWSLACTVVEMSTGLPPWADCDNPFTAMYRIGCEDEPAPIPVDVSGAARDFLVRCFVRSPQQRATSRELQKHPFIESDVDMNLIECP